MTNPIKIKNNEFIIDQSTLKNAKVEFGLFGGRKIILEGHDTKHNTTIYKKFTPHQLRKIIGQHPELKPIIHEKGFEKEGELSKENLFTKKMAEMRHSHLPSIKSTKMDEMLKNRPKMDPSLYSASIRLVSKPKFEFSLSAELQKKSDDEKIQFFSDQINQKYLETNKRFAIEKAKIEKIVLRLESHEIVSPKDLLASQEDLDKAIADSHEHLQAMFQIAKKQPRDSQIHKFLEIAIKQVEQMEKTTYALAEAADWSAQLASHLH